MNHQTEQQLENILIAQLGTLGFDKVSLPHQDAFILNLKAQLEKFNKTTFTNEEFLKILNHLNKGDRFQKAKTLRDRFALQRENNQVFYVSFFNTDKWCKNEYQVSHQITQEGRYTNRYDVTLLINGLPLVQIELKRRGVEMKEAFNQIKRYHIHSFTGTLFEYIQIFVISNGVNTKYFANNPKQSFEQTFFWTNEKNEKIAKLEDFANVFLEKCTVSKMIAEYIVLAESLQIPMILRPYQYYAVKAIEQRVKESNKNGYIWHTTGSGKTLTSFKASQVLALNPDISKVLFVVDRKDLDIQTTKEFNSFSDGSVDGTNNTNHLVHQLADVNRKLIVTTIQKLDLAIGRESYQRRFENLSHEKVVIIFDECHRSQFGQTHAKIKSFFKNSQLIGFTGTPIFADNSVGGATTKDVFDECLHKYIITNAISDNNVLGFAVEYVGKYIQRSSDTVDADIFADEMVEGINKQEVLEDEKRLNKISDYILQDWKRKTKDGKFNALFAVSRIDVLKKYYKLLNDKKSEDFKIAAIFTFQANEDETSDILDADVFPGEVSTVNVHSRDFLESCIKAYNNMFNTNFSTERFYDYFKDLQQRIKNKEVDLVLVVNMFLTGFDSKRLNTLYVDKNLKFHGLIQAYSRTNRLLDSSKPHGNIVSFRNLKSATDTALALFGDENAKEIVFKKPYEQQKKEFNQKIEDLKKEVPTIEHVNKLQGEEDKANFVKNFRDLLKIKSSLETFAEFSFDDLKMTEQEFYDYQSKYLDIYDARKNRDKGEGGDSIIDQIDFEIELTIRDIINYDYIIMLIVGLNDLTSEKAREKRTDEILRIFDRDVVLRKKKDLIKKFIEESLPTLSIGADVGNAFNEFWNSEKSESLKKLAVEENIPFENVEKLIGNYLYSRKLPRDQEIDDSFEEGKGIDIRVRSSVISRIKQAIKDLAEKFEW